MTLGPGTGHSIVCHLIVGDWAQGGVGEWARLRGSRHAIGPGTVLSIGSVTQQLSRGRRRRRRRRIDVWV